MNYHKNLSLENIEYYDLEGNICIEEWKDIQNYEGLYQVSDLGRVKSLSRIHNTKYEYVMLEKILKQSLSNGYPKISLFKNGIKTIRIHRLVAIHFIPNPLCKREVNHKKGIRTDNRWFELEWMTPSENIKHSFDTGSHIPHDCKGEKNGRAKLNQKQVAEIRELIKYRTGKDLAILYNVTPTTICSIKKGKLWKTV